MKLTHVATTVLFAMLGSALVASPLDEPRVSRLVNEVTVATAQQKPRRATGQEVLRPADVVHVGLRSRAELSFPDNTLTRLGAETTLAFRSGTRELTLAQGTLLIEVPVLRGGARVRLGALTAVCGAGTMLIEHLPARSLKIVVLEGDLRVAVGGFLGDSVIVPPGKMLITTPDVKFIPDPVDVDLSTLVKTSVLLNEAPLASLPRIQREIARQANALERQRLIPTNLAILGSGTNVVLPVAPASSSAARPPVEIAEGKDGTIATNLLNSAELAADPGAASPSP